MASDTTAVDIKAASGPNRYHNSPAKGLAIKLQIL